jgi:predicted NAD/FAD-binding protein
MRALGGPKRVAVVGAGVSGLVAAAELHRAGHQVDVFEAGSYPGGHTNTIDVGVPGGTQAVDTGFIVFNEHNYPNFERMLAELGVASQPADMSFSVSDGCGGFEWATTGPRGLFARPAHALDLRFHRMLRDLLRFNREARKLVGSGGRGPSLRRFLADGGYSEYFIERFLVPQASAVWSADPAQMWSFPAGFLAEFFENHRVLQLRDRPAWRSITGGSRRYVEALIAPFRDRVHLGAPVRRIQRCPGEVVVVLDDSSALFDEVVLAVHSDRALRMLADPSRTEAEVLGAIPYQRNEAVLHTDARLMPERRSAWASWNYHLLDRPTGRTTVTYHMNRLQSLPAERDFFVTLNLREAIDPGAVIRTIDYAHPVFTPEGIAAQRRWSTISGKRRTHYCGAYWRWGFHEDGVWSSLRVAEQLGGRGPLPQAHEPASAALVEPGAAEPVAQELAEAA